MNEMSRCNSEHMVKRSGISQCPMAKVSKRRLAKRGNKSKTKKKQRNIQ